MDHSSTTTTTTVEKRPPTKHHRSAPLGSSFSSHREALDASSSSSNLLSLDLGVTVTSEPTPSTIPSPTTSSPDTSSPPFASTEWDQQARQQALQDLTFPSTSSIHQTSPSPPISRTFSPLLWSDGGWHAGHFAFMDDGEQMEHLRDEVVGGEQGEGEGRTEGANKATSSDENEDKSGGSEGSDGSNEQQQVEVNKSGIVSNAVAVVVATTASDSNSSPTPAMPKVVIRSTLAPTAAPFVFSPKSSSTSPPSLNAMAPSDGPAPSPSVTAAPFTRLGLRPLVTTFEAGTNNIGSSSGVRIAPASSAPVTPPTEALDQFAAYGTEAYGETAINSASWALDGSGHLVGGDVRYHIADEILQLQSPDSMTSPRGGSGGWSSTSPTTMTSSFPRPQLPPPFTPSHHHHHHHQGGYPATPPPSTPASPDRSRSSSFGSQQSYFAPRPSHAIERSPTAIQLQNYFGPSPIEVLTPYDYPQARSGSTSPSHTLSRSVSSLSLYNTMSTSNTIPLIDSIDDNLYMEARETFVQTSYRSLSAAPTPTSRQAMMTHFDRSMQSPNPLASLYGLSTEQAGELAANPSKSGVSEVVLKVALAKGAAMARLGAQGGPSPNNRKLNLYKTELCRSWEEKGSCRYGTKCQFAHGQHEVREVARHPKFKSEVCRTFWLHGSCPYGRRCCFIHTTVPGGATTAPDSPSALKTSASSGSLSSALEGKSDMTAEPISRLHQRSSCSSLSSSSTPYGRSTTAFGPSLSSYLGPHSSASSSSTGTSPATAASSQPSLHPSPIEKLKPDFGTTSSSYSAASSGSALFGTSFDTAFTGNGLGLGGIKAPGRFTNNPSEVPPTYQDPPQSRLQRLASLGNGSITPGAFSFGGFGNGGGAYTTTPATSTSFPAPHTRHSSNSSFSTISSSTSSLFGNTTGFSIGGGGGHHSTFSSSSSSSFIPRSESLGSVSSFNSTFAPTTSTAGGLQSIGSDWLGSTKAQNGVNLDGELEEELSFLDEVHDGKDGVSIGLGRLDDDSNTPRNVLVGAVDQ